MHVPYLNEQGRKYLFVFNSELSKAYNVYLVDKKMLISEYVVFDELACPTP